jgi:hypothetical protein
LRRPKDPLADMTPQAGKKIVIVSPVFNDWHSYGELIERIGRLDEIKNHEVCAIAVDDCSPEQADATLLCARKGHLADVRIVRLACNMGPMRAIAVGLVEASKVPGIQAAIVMDADGEDLPDDVLKLMAVWNENPNRIVVAKRAERSEGVVFKLFYSLYKLLFRMLTGQIINFGSFSLIPRNALQSLIHNPAIWNNLPAAITRSRLPYIELATQRGTRFEGKSRMNFSSLVIHGLSGISVYTDVLFLRVIMTMGVFATLVLMGIVVILVIKFATNWATPGWASIVIGSLMMLLLQSLLITGFALFQLLGFRNLKVFVPALDASAFILDTEQVN